MIIVSACLAGFNTRYDGTNCGHPEIIRLVAEGRALPLCPEELGGLPIPRPPIRFYGGDGRELLNGRAKAIGADGTDYSYNLIKGANEILRIAKLYNASKAMLKEGSPSCGVFKVWVNNKKTEGCGVTASVLKENNIEVISIDSL
jgi:uncharacterized protein YbbK (DUF523 family)